MIVIESKTYAKTQIEAISAVAQKRYDAAMQKTATANEAKKAAQNYVFGIMSRHTANRSVVSHCEMLLKRYETQGA